MKRLFPLALILVSVCSFAATGVIEKSASPGNVTIPTGGTGLAQFTALSADFPSGTALQTKTLTGIQWTTTGYPSNTEGEVRLCYHRPYQGTEWGCTVIAPNASGNITTYNNQPFGPGAKVIIYHELHGGQKPGRPAGEDTLKFHYSY